MALIVRFLNILELIHCIVAIVSKLDFHRLIITEAFRYAKFNLNIPVLALKGWLELFPTQTKYVI